MRNKRFVAGVLTPALILLTIFVIGPIIASFVISLYDYNPLKAQNHFLGMENYIRMFQDKDFIKAFGNTIFFVFVTVALNIIITLVLSQLIALIRIRWLRNAILVMIFLACVAPLANSAVIWSRSMFPVKGGLINMILGHLGAAPVNWVGNPQFLMIAIIVLTLWADIGYNTVLFTAGVDGIPQDYYEAAEIDGAGSFQKFISITLPLLGRTFSFVLASTLISHFQMFAQFSILARDGGASKSGLVLTTMIYKEGFVAKDMGYASAISVALFVMIMIVTVIQQRLNRVDWGY